MISSARWRILWQRPWLVVTLRTVSCDFWMPCRPSIRCTQIVVIVLLFWACTGIFISPATFPRDLPDEAVMWTDTGLPCPSSRWCYFQHVCHAAGALQDVPWSEGERNVIGSQTGGLHIRTRRRLCLNSAAWCLIGSRIFLSCAGMITHFILHISCGSVCEFKDHFHTTNADIKPTLCVSDAEGHEMWRPCLPPLSSWKDVWKMLCGKEKKKRPLDNTQTFQ